MLYSIFFSDLKRFSAVLADTGSNDQFYKSLCCLAHVLSSFVQSLPILSDQTQAYLDMDARCCLALIHSLAHAAVIKFHSVGPNAAIYSGQSVRPPSNAHGSKLASVESAERIAWIAEYVAKNDLRLLDPFIGVCNLLCPLDLPLTICLHRTCFSSSGDLAKRRRDIQTDALCFRRSCFAI